MPRVIFQVENMRKFAHSYACYSPVIASLFRKPPTRRAVSSLRAPSPRPLDTRLARLTRRSQARGRGRGRGEAATDGPVRGQVLASGNQQALVEARTHPQDRDARPRGYLSPQAWPLSTACLTVAHTNPAMRCAPTCASWNLRFQRGTVISWRARSNPPPRLSEPTQIDFWTSSSV